MKPPDQQQVINNLLQEIARLTLEKATLAAMLAPVESIQHEDEAEAVK